MASYDPTEAVLIKAQREAPQPCPTVASLAEASETNIKKTVDCLSKARAIRDALLGQRNLNDAIGSDEAVRTLPGIVGQLTMAVTTQDEMLNLMWDTLCDIERGIRL